jgi:hypothetical protein
MVPAAAIATIPTAAGGDAAAFPAEPDPTFATLEAHRRVRAERDAVGGTQDALEQKIAPDRRKTDFADGIVEGDDPRWVRFCQEMNRLDDAENAAELKIADAVPTSLAGVIALLEYAAEMEDWIGVRADLVDENSPKKACSLSYFVSRNVAGALRSISVA